MTEPQHRPIDYDVRAVWPEDREWSARRRVSADRPGLARIAASQAVEQLVTARPDRAAGTDAHLSWVLEAHRRVVGCICTHLRDDRTRETPHPWTPIEHDTRHASPETPSLVLQAAYWARSARLDPVRVIRGVVLEAVQEHAFAEARVDIPFDPGTSEPADWLMMSHADYAAARRTPDPIACFLRAGFYLQGFYVDEAQTCVARLNWPNRAR
jgi:hypothetical protein